MQTMANALPWRIVNPFPQLMICYLCGRGRLPRTWG